MMKQNPSQYKLFKLHASQPEIKLHLITEACSLWNSSPEQSPFIDPYWGFYWPGGQALSRYILDNKHFVENKVVLDFGCGCGASGIAAIMQGAKKVLFNDIDHNALIATHLNGLLNELSIHNMSNENLIGNNYLEIDTILVGDLLYDEEFGNDLLQWLIMLHKREVDILVGDPGRFVLDVHPIKEMMNSEVSYKLSSDTILENKGFSSANVWKFK